MKKWITISLLVFLAYNGGTMTRENLSADTLKAHELKEEERLIEFVRESKLIFIGTVTELGPAPKFWSGRFPMYQKVTYQVEEVLKGSKISEITVEHIVVSRSRTARADAPGLSPALFQNGSRLIVVAVDTEDGRWLSLDENFGAQAYSEENLKIIKKAMGNK
jgi:hypothetical protein